MTAIGKADWPVWVGSCRWRGAASLAGIGRGCVKTHSCFWSTTRSSG